MSDVTDHTQNDATPPDLDNVSAIIQAAREHAEPTYIDPATDERTAFVVPAGARLAIVEPDESALEAPRRLTGSVQLEDVASLRAYMNEFYDPKATTAWVGIEQHRVVAVLNDARNGESAWRDHRAILQLAKTTEWERWRAHDGRLMGQEQFARHIEMSELDIVTPDAAELLEIAQTFYSTTTAEFRSGTRLQSGEVQFHYVEEQKASAGANHDLEIPAKFELRLAPFNGEEVCAVTALLRYRVRNGELAIGYELVRPDEVERDAMNMIAETLKTDVERVYLGRPA